MITSIEIGNFLSHSETKLEFDKGVTVFVGENGSGKSSIIDAITFALFGKHTRKSNKGLIKKGNNQAYSKINFEINGKNYLAERKIDSKGILAAKFSESKDGQWMPIASGERKQFGESMTEEIEKKIGLDFEKLKIASIVQQGELNSIIKAKPKEFKELLNTIIGIDKLDVAAELMKTVNKDFRGTIRKKIGFDDTNIEQLKINVEEFQSELKESKPIKKILGEKKKKYEDELFELKTSFQKESPKLEKLQQLATRKDELRSYAKEAIRTLKEEIAENERKISDCKGCFEYLNSKEYYEVTIQNAQKSIEEIQVDLQKMASQKASLQEKLALAQKLQLKDKKCPVCNSEVEKLNPLFQSDHLKQEIIRIDDQIKIFEKDNQDFQERNAEFSKILKKATHAEATLKAHAIKSEKDLQKIQEEIKQKKVSVKNIPIIISINSLTEVAELDSHAKMLFDSILKLEEDTKNFDKAEFFQLEGIIEKKQNELSTVNQQIGAILEKIRVAEKELETITVALSELTIVKEYVTMLDEIQDRVFNRDGLVATSLRSWALNSISTKASEYLTFLNTKIQRISLLEKTREISINCYTKNSQLDLESLSGGEQVSIALALRLGMASLLGASNLNLIILDEPTTHLDVERRKALVSVLSQISNITEASVPMQFFIITHDSEIFEDSTVEQIFKFESNELGSKVTAV